MQLTGIHHLTAVTANAQQNYRFYTEVLGLRLVKKTVNQDDVSAYHLFYGDGKASPGSDITFFDWPAAKEKRGNRAIVRTGFRIPGGNEAILYWAKRFREHGVVSSEIIERSGRLTLDFEDEEGQRLSLVQDDSRNDVHPWDKSSVPDAFQIIGLGPITLSVVDQRSIHALLTNVMNMRLTNEYTLPVHTDGSVGTPTVYIYEMGDGGPAAQLHVAVEPELPTGEPGAGGVHHVAFRVPNEDQYHLWGDRFKEFRVGNSGPIDRFYFKSLYLREANGILFELATDGPGFAVDEPMAELGEHLSLPPFLEPRRKEVERGLRPLASE